MKRRLAGVVFADTSYFYALLDPGDVNHADARRLAEEMADQQLTVATTLPVIYETVTLLRYRAGHRAARRFVETLLPALRVVEVGAERHAQALALFLRLGRDTRLSLCDALSFLVVREDLGDVPCLAFDRDFRRLGLQLLVRGGPSGRVPLAAPRGPAYPPQDATPSPGPARPGALREACRLAPPLGVRLREPGRNADHH